MAGEAAAADMAIKAIMGISSGITARANVRAANTVNAANAYASNLVRGANNELSAKRGLLARYVQSVNNQRALDNTGDQLAAAQVNYRRARDSATNDDLETQLKFAEQAGAQAATSAMSGMVGGVADIVAGTTALRKARIQQRTQDALRMGDSDAAVRLGQIAAAGLDSLDQSEIADNLDYGNDVAVEQRYGGNLVSEIWSGQSSQSLATLTSTFGTPKKDTAGLYKTRGGSQQTTMLQEQDSWFN